MERIGEAADRRTLVDSDDEQLAAAAQQGDHAAFARLYARYRPALRAHCRRTLGDPYAADDVVQETFLRAWARFDLFDTSRPLWPWLVRIAHRLCINYWHRNTKRQPVPSALERDSLIRDRTIRLDFVEQTELRSKVRHALSALTPRYRRLLLLHVLEGWSYDDLARAEGSTVTSVGKVLTRARARARLALEHRNEATLGVLAPILFVRTLGRRIYRRVHDRVTEISHILQNGGALPALCGCVQPVTASLLTIGLWLGTGAGAPAVERLDASRVTLVAQARAESQRSEPPAGSESLASPAIPRSPEPPGDPVETLLYPERRATPETTQFDEFTASPAYADDHTVFAVGRCPYQTLPESYCRTLYVSRDAGGSWHRMPATGFKGWTIFPSPAYRTDGRLFAMGEAGLQESTDGGNSFRLVNPLRGGAAISPRVDAKGPKVLMNVGYTILEYWADGNETYPFGTHLPPGTFGPTQFSPDSTLFVGIQRQAPTSADARTLTSFPHHRRWMTYACRNRTCEETVVPPWSFMRFSPRFQQDRQAYFVAGAVVYTSTDDGRTLDEIALPAWASDFAIASDERTGASTLFMTSDSLERWGMYRSRDEGRTWDRLDVDGFENAKFSHLLVTPTGRIIAAPYGGGIVCSEDNGETWHPRCTPETN